MRDLLSACRRLISPTGAMLGITLTIVLVVAMAVATCTCVLTVGYGLLYKKLGFPAEQQLASLTVSSTNLDFNAAWSAPFLDMVARQTRTMETVAAYRFKDVLLPDANGRSTGAAKAIMVQPALFSLLGARPALGRLLVAADAKMGAPPSVVLGWALWKSHYGGSRSVLNRSLRIEGRDHRVVGVLPEGFGFPQHDRQVWLPLVFTEDERSLSKAGSFWPDIGAVGLLKPGQSMSAASSEMMQLVRSEPTLKANAEAADLELGAQPLRYLWVADCESTLMVMLLAVLMVLAISISTVCYLYILHVLKQRDGFALLEPPRWMLCEVALLCTVGGTIGAALLPLGLLLLRHFDILPTDTPQTIGGDWATAVFIVTIVAVMAVVMTVAALGLQRQISVIAASIAAAMTLNGLSLQRQNVYEVLRQTGSRQTPNHGAQRLRKSLVVGQIALTLAFLYGMVLLMRGSDRLLDQDLGFERTQLLVGRLQPFQSPRAEDLPRQRAALAAWIADVSSMPGVDAVGLATTAPFGESVTVRPFSPPSTASLAVRSWPRAYTAYVNAQYFLSLGLPIVRGRAFEEEEARMGAPVAIIDANLARTYFGDTYPIGKTLSIKEYRDKPPSKVTVIGIAAVAQQHTLQSKDEYPSLYRPEAVPYRVYGIPDNNVEVLVRTQSEPTALIDALQHQVARVMPELRFAHLIPIDERIAGTTKEPLRLNALLQILGGYTILSALVGLYAVQAYMVSVRFREFGVLQALGADRWHIMKHVLEQGFRLIALGLLIGLPPALLLGRMLSAQLYGVSAFDPISLLAAFALISVIGLAANLGPAYRASQAKPMDVLYRE